MSERNFWEMIKNRWDQDRFVCVGLDSDNSRIPEAVRQESIFETMFSFNRAIVEATRDLVCAYKPNIAFYEAHGWAGLNALIQTLVFIRQTTPEVPIILDAKRADIGNTNLGYVMAAFELLRADAITVNPYFGKEALQSFLEYKDRGIFVLCRTSNPGAGEFQDLKVDGGESLYLRVARQVAVQWNENSNCGLVVGATYPEELEQVRQIVGDMTILIPGIGAQKGDVGKTVKAGLNSQKQGIIVNSSRGIIFASQGEDFAEAARQETIRLSEMINQYRD